MVSNDTPTSATSGAPTSFALSAPHPHPIPQTSSTSQPLSTSAPSQPPQTSLPLQPSPSLQQLLPPQTPVSVHRSLSPALSAPKPLAQSSPSAQAPQLLPSSPQTNPASSGITAALAQASQPPKPSPLVQAAVFVHGSGPAYSGPTIFPNVPAQAIVPAPPTTPSKAPPHRSIALEIARLITNYLGPNYNRRDAVGGTLSGLRTRLETDSVTFDNKRELLIWQVREAIRTEFFKIVYPAPPSQSLLNLVTCTETLLGAYHFITRPFFFPGARVAVPTEAGSRRAGTTLQLRFKIVAEATVTEALLHLDAPNGGTFQWVQTPALTPLIAYIQPQRRLQKPALPQRSRRPPAPRPQKGISRPRPVSRNRVGAGTARRKAALAQKTNAAAAPRTPVPAPAPAPSLAPALVPNVTSPVSTATTKGPTTINPLPPTPPPASPPPPPPPPVEPVPTGPLALPPTFLPESMLESEPPPRKRLREGSLVITHASGSLRRALDAREGEGAMDAAKKIKRLVGVERLVARRRVEAVEYYVKWCGRSMREGSWERRDALLVDVPGMVLDFDTRHPDLPKEVCHSNRVKTEAEEIQMRNVTESSEAERANGESTIGKGEKKDVIEADENATSDVEHYNAGSELETASSMPALNYVDEVTGIKIPPYLDTPIIELSFSGMLLQIRRPNEFTLHNDASSASRDYKRRQTRFKQENLSLAGKVFLLSKTEAKAALDTSLRNHKAHGRHPIPFPRGVGRVAAADTGIPFSKNVVEAAPPSWERYFTGLDLTAKRFERNLPPFFPSLDAKAAHKLALATRDIVHERAVEHRERARRVVRMAYRHGQIADSPACLFRDRQRRPWECADCFPVEVCAKGKTRSPRVPPPNEQLVKGRDALVAKGLANAKELDSGRWYDAHWSCWRGGNGRAEE